MCQHNKIPPLCISSSSSSISSLPRTFQIYIRRHLPAIQAVQICRYWQICAQIRWDLLLAMLSRVYISSTGSSVGTSLHFNICTTILTPCPKYSNISTKRRSVRYGLLTCAMSIDNDKQIWYLCPMEQPTCLYLQNALPYMSRWYVRSCLSPLSS